jgi:hypothetical protein
MKTSRFQKEYRSNASALHKSVGDCLRDSDIFSNYQIYQEYPVQKVNPDYPVSSHHFDWCIPALFLVIECHGEQHYEPVRFGGITEEEATSNFLHQKHRDNMKMDAAIKAGYTYLAIPYNDANQINEDYIWFSYQKLKNPEPVKVSIPKPKPPKHEEDLQKAREARSSFYQKMKTRVKEFKLKVMENK